MGPAPAHDPDVRMVGDEGRTMDGRPLPGIPSDRAFHTPPPSPPRRGLTDQPPLVAEFALPAETLSTANCSES
jgi:hypothetical protein